MPILLKVTKLWYSFTFNLVLIFLCIYFYSLSLIVSSLAGNFIFDYRQLRFGTAFHELINVNYNHPPRGRHPFPHKAFNFTRDCFEYIYFRAVIKTARGNAFMAVDSDKISGFDNRLLFGETNRCVRIDSLHSYNLTCLHFRCSRLLITWRL